ncbi:hypothetical protein FB45DRAFT_423361 [Roridomyces roridus]|uniref:AB hydrolase-1 domain-containing protein n=1 Tax=Roridomyces roridus TaxID=1738132 RepID=A0AAD7C5E5_9AGAR|nr:hypothetical protein FB45DRAFT_423361 [Roridomyces roridus]
MHLVSRSVTFTYCYDRPLQCIATQYKPDSSRPGLTLLFAGGIGINQETWQPIIHEVFRLSSLPGSSINIHSAWVVERPNHGDAALLNAQVLKEHYTELFIHLQYATAIQTLLNSAELSPGEKENIVGVAFSGGSAALIQCHELLSKQSDLRTATIRMLILVESPWVGLEAFPVYKVMYPFLRKANNKRPKSWKSVEDAMAWLGSRLPWSTFHPDVMQIISETHFCPDPQNPGCVTTKTTAEQETAAFIDDGTGLRLLSYLRTVLHRLPVHLVLSSSREFWSPEIQNLIAANVKQDRPLLASFTEMPGKGHYLTAEAPYEVASRVVHLLERDVKTKL